MGKLFDHATKQETLYHAWKQIRANGIASASEETKAAVELFDGQFSRNIRKIQRRLKSGEFIFDPQTGILKKKNSGGHRGIVMASVHNRVVERALLDTLQSKSELVRNVISCPTSVGGVPDRSVPHGLKLIDDAMKSGKSYFVRSDISGFFDSVARDVVLARIVADIADEKFMKILDAATTVTLENEVALGENRKVFPMGDDGVPQGSPLSPLFGNILLFDFDKKFNERGIICVRFIDDFVLLANEEHKARKAFESAKKYLSGLGLNCHDPFAAFANADKAQYGQVNDGFVFLGYDIRPGLFQPSKKARAKLQQTIDDRLETGKRSILDLKKGANKAKNVPRYAQTLASIDRVVRGWGNAFAYGNAPSTMEQLDHQIDEKLSQFRNWYANQIREADWQTKRRTGGVCLLSDIETKHLDDVPFKLVRGRRFVQSGKTLTISTDGSVRTLGKRNGRDRGPGGWACVVHETGQEFSGHIFEATNNEMELMAVIEAVKHTPVENSLRIRTDSQYVAAAVNQGNVIKSNSALWKHYKELADGRSIKVEWVKGHSGDRYNERADHLANNEAKLASLSGRSDRAAA